MCDPLPTTSKNACASFTCHHDSNEEEIELLEEWETRIMYKCKHCPGLEFTPKQKDRHKRWHKINGKKNKNGQKIDETLTATGLDNYTDKEIDLHNNKNTSAIRNEFNRRCKRCPGARFTVLGMKYHRKLHCKHLNYGQKNEAEVVTIGESSCNEDEANARNEH